MGNFTAQKLFQQINSSNTKGSNQAQGKSGFGGSETVMTLAEHDKKVHGGHYDGGRCKFREQMAAKGLLNPNGGNDGNSMQNVPTSGVATNVNENKNTNASPVQEDGELKTKFGSVNTTSQEAMEDINEIQRLHSEAKSPEAKQKIEEIYKGLVQKLGSSEGSVANNAQPKDSVNVSTQKEETFNPKTHDDVAEWYDKKSTELETRKNNGEISEEEYNRLQDDLDTKSDGYHESIEKSSDSGTQKNDSSNASPSKKDVSNHRKSLQDALRDQIYDRMDKGKATKEDEGGLDFMDAHEENDRKLREGKITAEEHAKNKAEINNDMMRRQYAQKFGVKYTPYVPKSSQSQDTNKGQVKQPTLSEQRDSLQKSLSNFQKWFGKNSIVGYALGNHYENKISEIDKQIEEQKKTEEEAKNIGEEAKKVVRESVNGNGGTSNRGLRTIHGDINHGGNTEIQKLIEEMESEYSNAKNTGEKMVILNRFKKLKSMYDQPKPKESSPQKESPTKSKRDKTSSDPFPDLTRMLNNMGEDEAYRTYHDLLTKGSRTDMELDEKDNHMLNILGTRFNVKQ